MISADFFKLDLVALLHAHGLAPSPVSPSMSPARCFLRLLVPRRRQSDWFLTQRRTRKPQPKPHMLFATALVSHRPRPRKHHFRMCTIDSLIITTRRVSNIPNSTRPDSLQGSATSVATKGTEELHSRHCDARVMISITFRLLLPTWYRLRCKLDTSFVSDQEHVLSYVLARARQAKH